MEFYDFTNFAIWQENTSRTIYIPNGLFVFRGILALQWISHKKHVPIENYKKCIFQIFGKYILFLHIPLTEIIHIHEVARNSKNNMSIFDGWKRWDMEYA